MGSAAVADTVVADDIGADKIGDSVDGYTAGSIAGDIEVRIVQMVVVSGNRLHIHSANTHGLGDVVPHMYVNWQE